MRREEIMHLYQLYPLHLLDPQWYESFDHYLPTDEFLRIVWSIIPSSWQLTRTNIWFRVSPPAIHLPQQGWKINASATEDNCLSILNTVTHVCVQENIPFDFIVDQHILHIRNSKVWPRATSSRFLTIYPTDDRRFRELLETLYNHLQGFVGPYLLSDRSYRDSHVVHYNYSSIGEPDVLTIGGEHQTRLVSPAGETIPEFHLPYWSPPPWVSDPFESSDNGDGDAVLGNGRYQIKAALGFSVSGGVYIAIDGITNKPVVIKEARPATCIDDDGLDAVERLRNEYHLLQILKDTNITPDPIEILSEAGHLFLVEEYVFGIDLARFISSTNPLMRVSPLDSSTINYANMLHRIWLNLANSLTTMHDRGIVCGNLSLRNIIVESVDSGKVRIVDLETAQENRLEYSSQAGLDGGTGLAYSKMGDSYCLGAVMLATMFPMNNMLIIEPAAKTRLIETLGGALGLSDQSRYLVRLCMSDDASERPSPQRVADYVQKAGEWCLPAPCHDDISREEIVELVDGIADYLEASADLRRGDRLFPADPRVFYTNPLSAAHGATGVAYALSRLGREISPPVLGWILSHPVNPDQYPPGLYLGSAGIAWLLWELGLDEVALQIMQAANNHPLMWEVADVFYGASGYGLACLRFYLATRDQAWLERAVRVGEWLIHSGVEGDEGSYWPDNEGKTWLGYARGASGIALYLLYLSLATGDRQFLTTGERALAFDLAHVRSAPGGHLSIPRGSVGSFENIITHYWFDGSAGVITTLARYWAHTRNPEYFDMIAQLAPDICRKYTLLPGLFLGLSGLGNALLDIHRFTGAERCLHEAFRIAAGITLFKLQRPNGIAFPGDHLLRISTDFGTGAAGIGLFLHRLIHVDQCLENFNFTLDSLIRGAVQSE